MQVANGPESPPTHTLLPARLFTGRHSPRRPHSAGQRGATSSRRQKPVYLSKNTCRHASWGRPATLHPPQPVSSPKSELFSAFCTAVPVGVKKEPTIATRPGSVPLVTALQAGPCGRPGSLTDGFRATGQNADSRPHQQGLILNISRFHVLSSRFPDPSPASTLTIPRNGSRLESIVQHHPENEQR